MLNFRVPPSHFYFPVIPSERGWNCKLCKNAAVKFHIADYEKVEYSTQKAVKLWLLTPGKKRGGLAQLNCLFSWVPCSVTALPLYVFASPISSFPRCWLALPPGLLFWISRPASSFQSPSHSSLALYLILYSFLPPEFNVGKTLCLFGYLKKYFAWKL